jgi:hypothetical protein
MAHAPALITFRPYVTFGLIFAVTSAPAALAAPTTPPSSSTTANIDTFPSPKIIWKLTLIQGKPVIKNIPHPSSPDSELELFGAKLTDQSGKAVGLLQGSIITVDVLSKPTEDVLRKRSLTFILPGGHIQAEGSTFYPLNAKEIVANRATRIAIVGGTGKFVGASGQVVTTRLPDGTYTQTIELVRY